MQDKRQLIIETALQLFGEKGFHLTSMQEIAVSAGIAKGSTYTHFKSKDDLLIAVYQHVFESWNQEMERIRDEYREAPRQLLLECLRRQFDIVHSHGTFILMQMNEHAVPNNEELRTFFMQAHVAIMEGTKRNIELVYGPKVRPFAFDAATFTQAVVQQYMGHVLIGKLPLDGAHVAELVAGALELVVQGFLSGTIQPVLNQDMLEEMLEREGTCGMSVLSPQARVKGSLRRLREAAIGSHMSEGRLRELEDALQALEEEWNREEPRMAVIRGMLSYIEGWNQPELEEELRMLQQAAAEEGCA